MKSSDFPPQYICQIIQQIDEQTNNTMAPRISNPEPKQDSRLPLDNSTSNEAGSAKRVEVRITRRSIKLLDADNLAGGCKHLIDAMRKEKLIVNDDPETIDLIFKQERVKTKKEQGMIVEII